MRRRDFIAGLSGAAAAWPSVTYSQQGERIRRVGVLSGYAEDDPEARARLSGFQQALYGLGWVVGRNLRIEYRWSRGDSDRAKILAKELVQLHPEVILGETTSVVEALKQATRTVPIIFTNVSNPIGNGFVGNLARPEGNITGFTNFESSMGGKWLDLVKEIVPGLSRVVVMFNPTVSPHIAGGYYREAIETVAKRVSIDQITAAVQTADDIERTIDALAGEPHAALIVLPDTFTLVHRDLIVGLAAKQNLPAIYALRSFSAAGGLLYYGINPSDQYPRAASYVDRILRGEKPGDLPVQAPTKFQMVINLKAAKALSLTIPEEFLLRADEVVE
jgi:putative tryptophan/tyrosine transport system substrate-binding protein